MSGIHIENITHRYGDRLIHDQLNADFASGRITCLLGSTGSGKTTLLRLIAGLDNPVSGTISIGGQIVTNGHSILVHPSKRNIGFIFQDLALWPHFNVLRNTSWGLKIKGFKDADERARAMLATMGLSGYEQKYPHQLSGGQQQLLALARALAPLPRVLLMDEPMSNLDTRSKRRLLDHIKGIQRKLMLTVVYVTHDFGEAYRFADDILILNDEGRVEAYGTKEEIANSILPFVRDFIQPL